MNTYREFFKRMATTTQKREEKDIIEQAELVKALEIRASQERMRLAAMLALKGN